MIILFFPRYVENFGLTNPCDNIDFVMRQLALSLQTTTSGMKIVDWVETSTPL